MQMKEKVGCASSPLSPPPSACLLCLIPHYRSRAALPGDLGRRKRSRPAKQM